MLVYLLRRTVGALVVMFIVSLMLFLVLHSLGNPVMLILGHDYNAALGARLTRALGLDRAWYVQYLQWLAQLVTGHMGVSYVFHQPVGYLIGQALPVTLELTFLAMLLAAVVGIPVGVLAATHRGSTWDYVIDVVSTGVISLPNFFVGILLILLFSLALQVLPATGYVPFGVAPLQNLRLMILPSLTLSLYYMANVARITRTSMLDTLSTRYVVTARSKGLSERRVIARHALRTALIPVLTLMGLNVGPLIGGAVVTETIFRLPGMGRLLVESVLQLDLPVVQGAVVVAVIGVVLTNIAVDLLYAALDPRIRFD